ncbi:acetyl-CoA carboxylase [Lactiplantibacillus plantarum]|nr:acetyl-CoA carboxylase [Lactiplantibacillus plantarum]MBS0945807.1 acetyl-CoA carboxylase [Lactiplantibacillus plantarum]
MLMNKDVKIIVSRIKLLFKRMNKTRYWLSVINDPIDQQFNFFFFSEHQGKRTRSVPLHSIKTYQLSYLEECISELKIESALSIEYLGFYQQRWPGSQYLIQKKRDKYE